MQTTDYKRSTGVSQSELKTLAESPRKYEAEYILKTLKREQTDAMRFGSLVHCLVLEPEDFDDHFVVIPPEALASNGHRRGKAWDEFKQQHEGKSLIFQEDYDLAKMLADKVHAHPIFSICWKERLAVEIPISWVDELTGVECKGIPDLVTNNEVILDVKTESQLSSFASDSQTSRTVADRGYHLQAAFYLNGCSKTYGRQYTRFVLIAIETQAPYRVHAYSLSTSAILSGQAKVERLLAEYKQRSATGDWSEAAETSLVEINLPTWAN